MKNAPFPLFTILLFIFCSCEKTMNVNKYYEYEADSTFVGINPNDYDDSLFMLTTYGLPEYDKVQLKIPSENSTVFMFTDTFYNQHTYDMKGNPIDSVMDFNYLFRVNSVEKILSKDSILEITFSKKRREVFRVSVPRHIDTSYSQPGAIPFH